LWAYEFEAGKFIAGEILGDTLYMYAPTGRCEKWVMTSEGVVLEYSSEPFYKADEIIAGINAHYGTSFFQEDDIDKDFTIGETMPNWNAYEKIEIQEIPIKVLVSLGSGYTFGNIFVESGRYDLESKQNEDNKVYILDDNGVVTGLNNYTDSFGNYMLSRINTVYPTINSVNQVFNENLEIGEQIDISEYIKI
jgi:hypothetical protein